MAAMATSELRELVQKLKADPQLLHSSELRFFADYLRSMGAKLPDKAAAAPAPSDVDESDLIDDEVVCNF